MNTNAINLDERFSDFELFQMFSLDCDPKAESRTSKVRYVEERYVFNDVKVPLWTNRKRRLPKRVKHFEDHIKPGITAEPAGSKGRLAALVAFYAENHESEVSAFDIPGVS